METFGTVEQRAELVEFIKENSTKKGAIIAILQKAQEIYGYLPIEVQKIIAEETNTPLAKLYGISTFYSQFYLEKKGECHVGVCLGTACYVKGAGDIMNDLRSKLKIEGEETSEDGRFSLEATRCIGACGLAPVLTVKTESGEDVHGRLVLSDVDKIIEQYQKEV